MAEATGNGTGPPVNEFRADLDAVKPKPIRLDIRGQEFLIYRFNDLPSSKALDLCRLEEEADGSKTSEIIRFYRASALIFCPMLTEALLDTLTYSEIKHISQLGSGAVNPQIVSSEHPGLASSSTSPAPLASTGGVMPSS